MLLMLTGGKKKRDVKMRIRGRECWVRMRQIFNYFVYTWAIWCGHKQREPTLPELCSL